VYAGLKEMSADDVTKANYLAIPLINSERAWSYAMQLKNDIDDGGVGLDACVRVCVRAHVCLSGYITI
jgi:hypothetical protein